MKYAIISRIGQGAYGVVLKARAIEDGETVAIKQILLKNDLKSQMEVYREINCLRNVDHENIIHLRETIFTSESVSLVFDYIETNLKVIINDTFRPQNDNITRYFFHQLLSGIVYLHDLKMIHRDLKPDNILADKDGKIKIADFGLACLYLKSDTNRVYSHQVATRWYRAPELLFGSTKYDQKVDIWAFGCILVEFLNGSPIFEGSNDIEQIARVFNILGTPTNESWPGWENLPDSGKVSFEERPPIEDFKTVVSCENEDLIALIKQILQLDPNKRPNARECLKNQYFRVPARLPIEYKVALPESGDKEPDLLFKAELELDTILSLSESELL